MSVRPEGASELGVKIEIKNMNSISGVRRALAYEIERQIDAVQRGETLIQSTRRWDDDAGQTFQMRTKESAHDYRYFPIPICCRWTRAPSWTKSARAARNCPAKSATASSAISA